MPTKMIGNYKEVFMKIYADNAATTKMSRHAIDAMIPYMEEIYGNPSSLYEIGQEAKEALESARERVARVLNCEPREIYFTSGGSEADNQAIISAARLGARKGKKHIISTAFEHHAVLHTLNKLKEEGFEIELAELNMGLEDRMRQPVGLLSGGQRQALTLMMATINPPKLLLLDEHTAALDPATADKVIELTKKIVADNKLTCLMITHNMQSALELGNRTLMMDHGRIIIDVEGNERSGLTVDDLLTKFKELSGEKLTNDRMLLS